MGMPFKGVPQCSDCQMDIRYCYGFPCLPLAFHIEFENLSLGQPPYGYCCGPKVGGKLAFNGACLSPIWGPGNFCNLVPQVEVVNSRITLFIPDNDGVTNTIHTFIADEGQTNIVAQFEHNQTGTTWSVELTELSGISNFMAKDSSGCPACAKISVDCEEVSLNVWSLDSDGNVRGRPSPSTAPKLSQINSLDPEADCYTFDKYLVPCSCIPSQICVSISTSNMCSSATQRKTMVWNSETCTYDPVIFTISNLYTGACPYTSITRTVTATVVPNECRLLVTVTGECMDEVSYYSPINRTNTFDRRCKVPDGVSFESELGTETVEFTDSSTCISKSPLNCCGAIDYLNFENPMCHLPLLTATPAGGCMTLNAFELSPQNLPPDNHYLVDPALQGCQNKFTDKTTPIYGTCPTIDTCETPGDLPISIQSAIYYEEPDCCPDPNQVVLNNYRLWFRIDGLCVGAYEALYEANPSTSTEDPLYLDFDTIIQSYRLDPTDPADTPCEQCDCCFDEIKFVVTD